MWSRSRTLGEITRGDRDGLKSIVLSNCKSMDDLSRQPRPLRAKFPSVTDLIAFYDSCEEDEDDDDNMSARRVKSRSVSELHILGGVSFHASKPHILRCFWDMFIKLTVPARST